LRGLIGQSNQMYPFVKARKYKNKIRPTRSHESTIRTMLITSELAKRRIMFFQAFTGICS
jgi:hypothetical protein